MKVTKGREKSHIERAQSVLKATIFNLNECAKGYACDLRYGPVCVKIYEYHIL